ncbi:MAG: DUF6582 domain-containing protein, partial [Micromonosporaceae bacterium]
MTTEAVEYAHTKAERYADPGYQADGKKRYALDTEAQCRAAWSYINQAGNAAEYTPTQLKTIKGRIKAALKRHGITVAEDTQEAHVPTDQLQADTAWREAIATAVRAAAPRYGLDAEELLDVDPDDHESEAYKFVEGLEPAVTMSADDPTLVRVVESALALHAGQDVTEHLRLWGRVMEAKGTTADGGRVYRVRILKYGTSRNRRRYTEAVMRRDAHLYEGAKCYDHHRDDGELRSSTIRGLVGQYHNVAAEADGVYGDLHLLPSATHAAEAIDASLAAQDAGREPLVGFSHDVHADFKVVHLAGGRYQEATAIKKVNSADLVADPSAAGIAVRALAGGTEPEGGLALDDTTEEQEEQVTTESVLAALGQASDEQLAAAGLTRASATTRTTEAAPVEGEPKGSYLIKMMIRDKVTEAALPTAVIDTITTRLPARVTEANVDSEIAAYKALIAPLEAAGLVPSTTVQVVRESREKKVAALDAFFAGDFSKGYRSFKAAYIDITGNRPDYLGGHDFNRQILRESWGENGYDSGERATESADTSTWAQLLGDSVTRRVVAEYGLPNLQTWRQIVSDIQPVEDFRTQRVGRLGGYGTLPAVLQGEPYQPLTTPPDEEATYAITKRGGTEDLTIETIANDDRRVISKIPVRLGRAAAQTLYRFVWDMLVTPVTCTYDSVALFDSGHANTDTSAALSQTTLATGRQKMRDQAAYGDTSEILGLQPRFLVVPNELEELAFQLCTSAVAIPATPAGPSNTPNINNAQNLTPILVPYLTDANDWFLVADPNMTPTIEIGFYNGREDPEVFTQS